MLSPVGAALLGRAVGDVVSISLPNGRATTAEILAIERPHCQVEEGELC
jgi:transcription elongation GreA/GreB family factor